MFSVKHAVRYFVRIVFTVSGGRYYSYFPSGPDVQWEKQKEREWVLSISVFSS